MISLYTRTEEYIKRKMLVVTFTKLLLYTNLYYYIIYLVRIGHKIRLFQNLNRHL